MAIVERIQLLCEKKNISVPALEMDLGLSKGSIYKWHKSSPKVESLEKVADYFNVTMDSLLARTIVVDDINNIDNEARKIITAPNSEQYILLTKKAVESGMPPEVLETLIKLYTK